MSFGVLLVGLGQIGMGYDLHHDATSKIYTHARAFSQHPDFYLIAAVDPDEQQRETFEQTFQCPAYADVDIALSKHKPHLVIIAVPTQYHGTTLRRVLEQSEPRAILCEKPLSYELDEARAMVEACSTKNVSLYINYMRRSDPGVIEVKRRLDIGEISTPVKGIIWYSKGLQHNGSHFFNLLEYWLGPLESADILDPGRLWDDLDPEPDVRLVFSGGTIIMLAAWEEAFSHYGIELLGKNGRLRYERGGKTIQWQGLQGDSHFDGYTVLHKEPETISSGMERYQWHVAEQLALAFNSGNYHLCSGQEALTTLQNMQTITAKR